MKFWFTGNTLQWNRSEKVHVKIGRVIHGYHTSSFPKHVLSDIKPPSLYKSMFPSLHHQNMNSLLWDKEFIVL